MDTEDTDKKIDAIPLEDDQVTWLDAVEAYANAHWDNNRRDRFAAMAMQGILANHAMVDSDVVAQWVARAAVNHADALIAELDKRNERS